MVSVFVVSSQAVYLTVCNPDPPVCARGYQAYQDAMDIAPMIEYLRNKSTNHSPLIMISDGWQVLLLPDIFVLLPHLSEICGALDIL